MKAFPYLFVLLFLGSGFDVNAQVDRMARFYGDTINRKDANGKKQGQWIILGKDKPKLGYQQNHLVEEGNFQNSRKVGFWRKYYPNQDNTLKSEITYVNGRAWGPYTTYWKNGNIREKGTWERKNVSDLERHYENGNLQNKFFFNENGRQDGQQFYYAENGQLQLVIWMRNGVETKVVRYWPDGTIKSVEVKEDAVVMPGTGSGQ